MAGWNATEREVRDAIRERLAAGTPAMVATVVDVRGSAYRRPGAKMVVSPSGETTGAVTAACLTDEVRRLADRVVEDGDPRVETYDLTGGDDAWGLGVGCSGVIDLLLEPLDEGLRPLVDAHESGANRTLATVVDADDDRLSVGDRASVNDPASFPADLAAEVRAVDAERSRAVEVATDRGCVSLFLDRIAPPPRLVVVGTGHDVRPVVDLAAGAGFEVSVVGFRGAAATRERFPAAERVVSTRPSEVADAVALDPETSVVVMSHNFLDDRIAVRELVGTPVEYVGVMGPADRFDAMREAFAEEGRPLTPAERDAVYAPVGLDLGGDAPRQVAHSIVAEVLAVRNDREGGHLRAVDGPIHGRPDGDPCE